MRKRCRKCTKREKKIERKKKKEKANANIPVEGDCVLDVGHD